MKLKYFISLFLVMFIMSGCFNFDSLFFQWGGKKIDVVSDYWFKPMDKFFKEEDFYLLDYNKVKVPFYYKQDEDCLNLCIYFHGNADFLDRENYISFFEKFKEKKNENFKFDIINVEFPGYSISEDKINDENIEMYCKAIANIIKLRKTENIENVGMTIKKFKIIGEYPNYKKNFSENNNLKLDFLKKYKNIIVCAHSLGCYFATRVAYLCENSEEEKKEEGDNNPNKQIEDKKYIDLLFLNCPFADSLSAAKYFTPYFLHPIAHFFVNKRLNNVKNVKKITCPTIILSAENDNVTNPKDHVKVFHYTMKCMNNNINKRKHIFKHKGEHNTNIYEAINQKMFDDKELENFMTKFEEYLNN